LEYMLPKLARNGQNEVYVSQATTEEMLLLDEKSRFLLQTIGEKGQSLSQLKQKFGIETEILLQKLLERKLIAREIKTEATAKSTEYLYEALINIEMLETERVKKKLL